MPNCSARKVSYPVRCARLQPEIFKQWVRVEIPTPMPVKLNFRDPISSRSTFVKKFLMQEAYRAA